MILFYNKLDVKRFCRNKQIYRLIYSLKLLDKKYPLLSGEHYRDDRAKHAQKVDKFRKAVTLSALKF